MTTHSSIRCWLALHFRLQDPLLGLLMMERASAHVHVDAVSASEVILKLMNLAVKPPTAIGRDASRISSILILMGAILFGPNLCAQVGTLDPGFSVPANGPVHCALTQPDGKILVFGNFTTINGQPKVGLARLTSAGTVDSTFYSNELGVDGLIRSALLQRDGKIVIAGDFLNVYGVSRQRIARLNADGTLDESFATQSGANATVNSIAYDSIRNTFTVGGAFTEFQGLQRGSIALLNINGSIDANAYSGSGFDGPVFNVLIDNSLQGFNAGGTFVGGLFTSFNGISRRNLAKFRLFTNVFDTSFNSSPTSGPNGAVRAIAMGGSGQLMVGGDFSAYSGVPRGHLVSISSSSGEENANFALSCDAPVHAITAQSPVTIGLTKTEKYLVGGDFRSIGTETRLGYARLVSVQSGSTPTWGVEADFDEGANGRVLCIALQKDGKPLIAGEFENIGGGTSPYFARLYGDGGISPPAQPKLDKVGSGTDTQLIVIWNGVSYVSGYKIERSADGLTDWVLVGTSDAGSPYFPFVDGNLTPGQTYFYRVRAFSTNGDGEPSLIKSGTTLPAPWSLAGSPDKKFIQALGQGPSGWVYTICPLPDGKNLVGGSFSSIGDFQRRNIARINADGSVDSTFDTSSGPNDAVYAIAVQPDGKILIGGSFTSVAGVTRNRIARLNSDGSLDSTFDPLGGANSQVEAVALFPDNKIAVAGRFSTFTNESVLEGTIHAA